MTLRVDTLVVLVIAVVSRLNLPFRLLFYDGVRSG